MTAGRISAIAGPGIVFIVLAGVYAALGSAVSFTPPRGIDAAARHIAGEAPALAWLLTESCLWPVLSTFGVTGTIVAWFVPTWRARIVFAIVTTLVTWQLSNALKDVFRRPRPEYWIVHHELSYAYSSGHAMFAVLVYWLWAFFIARSSLPRVARVLVAGALSLWGGGVIWSRLALGAHYPSDLIGGMLLAGSMLAGAATVAKLVAPDARIA